ncbi:hypothetical protein Q8A73_021574 [Channa argus]|nr:hypothetical protein Q8A73_021574 [Channa argus]
MTVTLPVPGSADAPPVSEPVPVPVPEWAGTTLDLEVVNGPPGSSSGPAPAPAFGSANASPPLASGLTNTSPVSTPAPGSASFPLLKGPVQVDGACCPFNSAFNSERTIPADALPVAGTSHVLTPAAVSPVPEPSCTSPVSEPAASSPVPKPLKFLTILLRSTDTLPGASPKQYSPSEVLSVYPCLSASAQHWVICCQCLVFT